MSWKNHKNFSSMAEALPMVKKMIREMVKKATKIPTWVLTSFNDPFVKLEIKTKDVKKLLKKTDALKYVGNPADDFKEQALEGNLYRCILKSVPP